MEGKRNWRLNRPNGNRLLICRCLNHSKFGSDVNAQVCTFAFRWKFRVERRTSGFFDFKHKQDKKKQTIQPKNSLDKFIHIKPFQLISFN